MIVLPLLAGGLVAGSYGSMVGAGGGFLIVPLLLFLFPTESPAAIAATSLLAVLFSGLSATGAYARLKRIDYRMGLSLAVLTVPGAIAGVYLVSHIPRDAFQGALGLLLVGLAIYLLTRPSRVAHASHAAAPTRDVRRLVDSQGTVHTYRDRPYLGGALSVVTGLLSSMLGIGGGLLRVPMMVFGLGVPIQIAAATSEFVTATTAFTGTVTHGLAGNLSFAWWEMGALTLGVVVGAQVGSRLSTRFSGPALAKLLSVGLVVVGARMITTAV